MDILWNTWKDKTIYDFLLFMNHKSKCLFYISERNSFQRPSITNIYTHNFDSNWWDAWKQFMIYDKGWIELHKSPHYTSVLSQLLIITLYDGIIQYICNNVKYKHNIDANILYYQIKRKYFTKIQHNSFFNICHVIFFQQVSERDIDALFNYYSTTYWICTPYGIIHDLIQMSSIQYMPMSIILISKQFVGDDSHIKKIDNILSHRDTASIYQYNDILLFSGYNYDHEANHDSILKKINQYCSKNNCILVSGYYSSTDYRKYKHLISNWIYQCDYHTLNRYSPLVPNIFKTITQSDHFLSTKNQEKYEVLNITQDHVYVPPRYIAKKKYNQTDLKIGYWNINSCRKNPFAYICVENREFLDKARLFYRHDKTSIHKIMNLVTGVSFYDSFRRTVMTDSDLMDTNQQTQPCCSLS